MAPDAPYHYACDFAWWDIHYEAVKAGFNGQSYTVDDLEDPKRNPDQKYDLIRCRSKHGAGLSKEFLHYGLPCGGNSGYQALNLAYMFGAGTALLLGFDMFGGHFFGNHPPKLAQGSPFQGFIESFRTVTELEVINCTRMTVLDCFPRTRIELLLL